MNKLARAYGNMLDREWNYFSTLTYKWPVKQNSNRKIMDRLANTLYSKDKKFEMFWVSEWHSSGSSVHNHLNDIRFYGNFRVGENFSPIPYGSGVMIYNNGSKYDGKFREGKRHGI